MASNPWWVINGMSGTPPQYILTQNATKPQPGNPAFTVTGPYAAQANALAALPPGSKYSIQAWNSVKGTFGAILQTLTDAATGTTGPAANTGSTCLVTIPVVGCLLTKTQARALIGGLLIAGGAVIGLVSVMLLAAEGMQRTGAGTAAGRGLEHTGAALAFVPGLEGAGLAVGAAGSAAKRAGSASGAQDSLARRRVARESAKEVPGSKPDAKAGTKPAAKPAGRKPATTGKAAS